MTQSTHYNLKLAEGTDLVNPLTIDVPNYQTIDSAMFANEQAGVGTATELKSGTIHAITRANTNRNIFRFKSTSVFLDGDTFTVDGSTVTALYPDGSSLKDRCFIIGSDILCLLDGAQLTVLATYYPEATNVEYESGVSVKQKIDDIDLTDGGTIKGNLDIKNTTNDTILSLGGGTSNSVGTIRMYDASGYRTNLVSKTLTTNKEIKLPNENGVMVVASDSSGYTSNYVKFTNGYPQQRLFDIQIGCDNDNNNYDLIELNFTASGISCSARDKTNQQWTQLWSNH